MAPLRMILENNGEGKTSCQVEHSHLLCGKSGLRKEYTTQDRGNDGGLLGLEREKIVRLKTREEHRKGLCPAR